MLCYQDQTFCASPVEKHTCGREFTEEDVKFSERSGLPIAWGYFCGEPDLLTSKKPE